MIHDYTSSVRAETYLVTQHVLTKCPTDNRVCSEQTSTRGQQGVQRGNMYPWTTGCAAKKQVPVDNRCVQRGNKYPWTTRHHREKPVEQKDGRCHRRYLRTLHPVNWSTWFPRHPGPQIRRRDASKQVECTQADSPHAELNTPPRTVGFVQHNVLTSHTTVSSPHTRQCPHFTHDSVLASHTTVPLSARLRLALVTGPEQCAQTA